MHDDENLNIFDYGKYTLVSYDLIQAAEVSNIII